MIGLIEFSEDSVSEDVSPGVSVVLGDNPSLLSCRDCKKLWYPCTLLASGESSCDVTRVMNVEGPSRGDTSPKAGVMGEKGTTRTGDTSPGDGVLGEEGIAGMDGTSPRAGVLGEEVTTRMGGTSPGTGVMGEEVTTGMGDTSPGAGVMGEEGTARKGGTSIRGTEGVDEEEILAGVRTKSVRFILSVVIASEQQLLLVMEVWLVSPSLSLDAYVVIGLLYWLLQDLCDLLMVWFFYQAFCNIELMGTVTVEGNWF